MAKKISKKDQAILDTGVEIMQGPPRDLAFLHATLCQVHLPRSKVDAREYIRTDGTTSLRVEAGSLWDGRRWVDQALPSGVKPRLVMLHLNSYALRHKTKAVPVEDSLAGFLRLLGLSTSGGKRGSYYSFRQQINALAACKMQLGWVGQDGRASTSGPQQPIERFDAWLSAGEQQALWPGVMHLSDPYYDTLLRMSVPLDPRAIGALSQSAMDLDIYTWLAHRLHRVRQGGQVIHWHSLRNQFGLNYGASKDFKRQFKVSLARALSVYPAAKVDSVRGGLRLYPSPTPIPKTKVVVPIDSPRR